VHAARATAAAILGDLDDLVRHTAAAMPLLGVVPGIPPTVTVRVLRGLALAGQARAADDDERGGLVAELDDVIRWLARRAADAPENFLHLSRLLEAERAWAVGDIRGATAAFDVALLEVGRRRRPWHRALTTERAARFSLAQGLEHAGHRLLAEARQEYLAWGRPRRSLSWTGPTRHFDRRSTKRQAAPASRRGRSTCSRFCPLRRRSARRPASGACTTASSTCSAP
jgi:hypothetical protein